MNGEDMKVFGKLFQGTETDDWVWEENRRLRELAEERSASALIKAVRELQRENERLRVLLGEGFLTTKGTKGSKGTRGKGENVKKIHKG